MSDSLQPHELQHERPPCPSPTPRVDSNSRPPSQWCHPAISSSVVPFSSCPQSLPASGSFPMSQLFAWGGQSVGVSASASVLPMNTQDLSPFRMDWLALLAVQGALKSLLQHHSSKASILQHSSFFTIQLSHPYVTSGKTIALTRQTFVGKVMSLLFIIYLFIFSFIFISWRLITLQYCSGFCHTLTWISHGFTCIPHPDLLSHLPLYPVPLSLPSAPGPSTCLMRPTWAGDLFHYR